MTLKLVVTERESSGQGGPERARGLEDCEATIDRALSAFWEMGAAYGEIRERKLYKRTHSTWASYCEQRWGISKESANYVIKATEIRTHLAQNDNGRCQILPTTEYQTRALALLPESEQADAWHEAVDAAQAQGKGQPTHDDVKAVVDRRREPPAPPRQPTPEEVAHDAAKQLRDSAHSFQMAAHHLMPHIEYLDDHEADGCALTITQTLNAVPAILEEHGHLPSTEPLDTCTGRTIKPPEVLRQEKAHDLRTKVRLLGRQQLSALRSLLQEYPDHLGDFDAMDLAGFVQDFKDELMEMANRGLLTLPESTGLGSVEDDVLDVECVVVDEPTPDQPVTKKSQRLVEDFGVRVVSLASFCRAALEAGIPDDIPKDDARNLYHEIVGAHVALGKFMRKLEGRT